MRLDELLHTVAVKRIVGDGDVEVTGVVHDSREVAPGVLFCCVSGTRVDGHEFAPAARRGGAAALLCERELPIELTQVLVADTRAVMGEVAAAFWGRPSRELTVVGVTGTNGKTTITHFLGAIFEAAGQRGAVIGTLTGSRTTPDATELQARLASLRSEGVVAVAMEVSSHALVMRRIEGTMFAVGVFTNLSRDHLDFHRTMEDYFAAKATLFSARQCRAAVVNVDDPWGRRLVDALTIPWQPYGLSLVDDVVVEPTTSRCRWEGVELIVPVGGRFNLSNALGAAVAARTVGIPPKAVAAGIAAASSVPGRFEPVDAGQPFAVIVDYAHTPDALSHLLNAARDITGAWGRESSPTSAEGRVHLVFGCGGDRDRTKRGAMGEVAAAQADRVIVTSDNPRSESSEAIIEAIVAGMPDAAELRTRRTLIVEPDRRAAIAAALAGAGPGDVVLIAGKGHETTQTIGDRVVPFDDRIVAREFLEGAA